MTLTHVKMQFSLTINTVLSLIAVCVPACVRTCWHACFRQCVYVRVLACVRASVRVCVYYYLLLIKYWPNFRAHQIRDWRQIRDLGTNESVLSSKLGTEYWSLTFQTSANRHSADFLKLALFLVWVGGRGARVIRTSTKFIFILFSYPMPVYRNIRVYFL